VLFGPQGWKWFTLQSAALAKLCHSLQRAAHVYTCARWEANWFFFWKCRPHTRLDCTPRVLSHAARRCAILLNEYTRGTLTSAADVIAWKSMEQRLMTSSMRRLWRNSTPASAHHALYVRQQRLLLCGGVIHEKWIRRRVLYLRQVDFAFRFTCDWLKRGCPLLTQCHRQGTWPRRGDNWKCHIGCQPQIGSFVMQRKNSLANAPKTH
jgi:hypothetical protein